MHLSVKAFLSALLLAPIALSQAKAADLPAPLSTTNYAEPATPAVPEVDPLPWQGFHVGALAGYQRYDETIRTPFGPSTTASDGALLGGLAGFDIQFGNLVLGAEADTSFGDVSGINNKVASRIRQLSTFRGRAGISAGDLLFYGTAGLAAADMESKARHFGDDNQVVWGWTYGGGVEAKLTENVSLRGEYLYTRLDNKDLTYAPSPFQGTGETNDFHTFRAAVSYQLPLL